ncbi:MAG: tetratricopeptide repeat protein [Ignavibacteriales bacterium]|nr:tetratricopeptide repeat protein [Ignavibacteriales bacterium]
MVKKSPQILLHSLLLLFVSSAWGQDIDVATRLRLAQSFEQSGDWERVVSIYEELHRRDPTNYVFFDGLRRAYAQTKKYDEAIELVEHRLRLQPKDPHLTSILAGLHYEKGDESKADSMWQLVLLSDRKNASSYRLVASQMLDHRLFEHAIKTYLSARSAGLGQDIFAEELGSIYSALQQYGSATKEFIRILKRAPEQLPYIENRIASFSMRNDGLRAATAAVQEEIRQTPANLTLRSLLAWMAIEGKDFESAYQQYRVIDSLRNAKGHELFNFGQRALQERAFRVAAKTFRVVIEQQAPPTILPQARLGYARAIEELSDESDTSGRFPEGTTAGAQWPVSESQPSYSGAIALYGRIIAEYPHSELAAQAHYRIGCICFDRFFDLDRALSAFELAKKGAKSPSVQFDATLKVAEVLAARGNLFEAKAEYLPLTKAAIPAYRDKALFQLAELDYFAGSFDSSLARLGLLTSNVNIDLANDALQLQYFVQENKSTSSKALQEFAKADLLVRQRKFSEALGRFKEIAASNPTVLLVDDTMMRIGELQLMLKQTSEAMATFQKVAAEMQTSILRDRAQLRIGEIFQNVLKDKAKAIEAYELLLAKYPNSMYVEEVRKRIRFLRGDAI